MDAMLTDLEDFIRSVSHAAGEEAPKFRRSDLAEHLTSFLGQVEDGDAEFACEGEFALFQHAYLAPGGEALFVPGPGGVAAFDEVSLDSDEALPWLEHYHRRGQHPPEWPAVFALPPGGGQYEEAQHPRGQPENRGQFSSKGGSGEQAGQQQGQPAPQPKLSLAEIRQRAAAQRFAQDPGGETARRLNSWLDSANDKTDWAGMSKADKEALASALATKPEELAKIAAKWSPWEKRDDKQEKAVQGILQRALDAVPAQPKVPLTAANFQEGWIVDLSRATGKERDQAETALKLVSPSDALTGKAVRVVFPPEGMHPDVFTDYLESVPGMEQVGHLGGETAGAVRDLYDLSVAPEQVALTDVPVAARGLDQSDAERFHADYVATYKRVSRDVYVQKDTYAGSALGGARDETYAVVPRANVPEVTGIPKYLLDRNKDRVNE